MATITKRLCTDGVSWGARVRVVGNPTLTRSFGIKIEAERWAALKATLIARHRDLLLGAPARSFGQKSVRPRSSATVRTYLQALPAAGEHRLR